MKKCPAGFRREGNKCIRKSYVKGRYVILTEDDKGDLSMQLTPDGRAELQDIKQQKNIDNDLDVIATLIEDPKVGGSGWGLIPPEDIGALTSAPIIAEDFSYDDAGNLEHPPEKLWWFPDYMVRSVGRELLQGEVIFQDANR
jgi:hypothetical protein